MNTFVTVICLLLLACLIYDMYEGKIYEGLTERIFDVVIYKIPLWLVNFWMILATILYFIGNFTVLALLCLGVFILGYSIFNHINEVEFTFVSLFNLAKQLAEEKVVLYGATSVAALTVAVGHMFKLNLDKRQFYEKLSEKRLEESEAKNQKKLEQQKVKRPAYKAHIADYLKKDLD